MSRAKAFKAFNRGYFPIFGLCAALASPLLATDGKGAFDNLGAHPGMTVAPVTGMENAATQGIGWLSNGDMVWVRSTENYGGGDPPSASAGAGVWLVKGLPNAATVSKISDNMRQPTGVAVGPGDEIMVPDRDAIYKFTPTGTKTKVLDNPVPNAWHQWIFTPMYFGGKYYAPYSGTIKIGGPSTANPSSEYSGAMLTWTSNGAGGFSKFAGGFRSCNGSGLGSGPQAGFMMVADNQGSWEPSCPIHLIRQNRFYGHKQNSGFTANWAQAANAANPTTMPYDPPVAWMLDSDAPGGIPFGAGQSTSQPIYVDRGPFEGDWIVGDINQQQLARIALDPVDGGLNVNGKFNGSVHFFTGGFGNSAINRLSWHPTAPILYVGTTSTAGNNWPTGSLKPFYQVSFNDAAVTDAFEMLGVKSRANGVEIEFSQPVAPATAVAGSFLLNPYQLKRQDGYGAGNETITKPPIDAVQISGDHKRVFLQIGNFALPDRVIVITAAGIRSEAGNGSLFFNRTWFTHNYQSTQPFNPTTGITRKVDKFMADRISHSNLRPGVVSVKVDLDGPYSVSLRSVTGRQKDERKGNSPSEFTFTPGMGSGISILQVRHGDHNYLRPLNF